MVTPRLQLNRALARFNALFGRAPAAAAALVLLACIGVGGLALGFWNTAAPDTLTIASGPEGSTFQRYAQQYQKILARQGVTLRIVVSQGSEDNLRLLRDPRKSVDVGFVLGGEAREADVDSLRSLGSVSYQPLMIFYRGDAKQLLSEFKGLRIDIGPPGSGTQLLAQTLLAANGVRAGDGTTFVDTGASDTVRALHEQRIDAFFAMSESTSTDVIRQLLRTPDVHLFSVAQADGYARRYAYLNKLRLPRGSLDFGEDIPGQDVQLIAPTVELVARQSLHPAISDLLLEAAREVHGKPGLYKERGEFPAPLEHEFQISPDALRYYASGKSFLYRTFPFWAASLIARIVAVVVPVALVLIPAVKLAPTIYRWRMTSRIYRWYGALQRLEREGLDATIDAARRADLLRRLDHIEKSVLQIVVPPAFGDLFFGLRSHIGDVRERLMQASPRWDTHAAEDLPANSPTLP